MGNQKAFTSKVLPSGCTKHAEVVLLESILGKVCSGTIHITVSRTLADGSSGTSMPCTTCIKTWIPCLLRKYPRVKIKFTFFDGDKWDTMTLRGLSESGLTKVSSGTSRQIVSIYNSK